MPHLLLELAMSMMSVTPIAAVTPTASATPTASDAPKPAGGAEPVGGVDFTHAGNGGVSHADLAQEQSHSHHFLEAVAESPEILAERLKHISVARNPLLEAAEPLLLLLAQMPQELDPKVQVSLFQKLLQGEVRNFLTVCGKAKIAPQHIREASFFLCTAIDEAASGTSWGGSKGNIHVGAWAAGMLAQTFHEDTQGGIKFFNSVDRLSTDVEQNADLLEVMYYILCLGFKGQYSAASDAGQLISTRRRLYRTYMAGREQLPSELALPWQGVAPQKMSMMRQVPAWLIASVLACGLVGLFGWYKYQLTLLGRDVELSIAAIGRMTPPPVSGVVLNLAELLKNEIALGLVSVTQNSDKSTVTFRGDDMFSPGNSVVSAKIQPIVNKVAREINNVSGSVHVIGHSDNQPIRTRLFASNQVLSEERANGVADILLMAGVNANRIEIRGLGAVQPVATNDTAIGRAKNRRVEISVFPGQVAIPRTPLGVSPSPSDARS